MAHYMLQASASEAWAKMVNEPQTASRRSSQ